ncbi:Guanine nucleotide-binding protein alpha-2 subunit [Lambiella insularis]|nr:Guanine nucleotide-binding protein alpha-2 subunit [Lambiella insularis]
MGLPRDVSHSLARQLQHLNGNRYSQQELQHYRREILDRTLLDVRHILQHMEDSGVQLEDCEDKRNALFVLEHSDSTNEWAPELAIAINKLWANAIVRKAMTDCSLHLHSTPYFFENLPRIAASNYAPTTTDILSIPTTCTTRNQYVIPIGPSDLYLIDTYSFLPRARRKQLFESPDAILFLVDISSYNRLLGDGTYTTDNALAASMCDLESVVRSLRGHQVAMLLLFHNVASFKEKLASDPLARYLPDYSGEDSVEKAVEYVAQRFRQLSRAGVAVHVQVLDLQDVASVRRVWDTLNESVLRPLPAIAAG